MAELRLARPLRLFAPAKVNLGLEVVRRRHDGYHDIVTIFQAVSLFDEILITPSGQFQFAGDSRVSTEDDLAYRAIKLFEDRFDHTLKATVKVRKRIPIAAGLGGGSSDAGTILAALCRLAGQDQSVAESLGAELGSDVPFFVRGGTALATGTGTAVEVLPSPRRAWLVFVTPDIVIQNKTAVLYRQLTADDFSDGETTREFVERLRAGCAMDASRMQNAFSRPLYAIPEIRAVRDTMLDAGAVTVLPSGAGPTLFSVAANWEDARELAHRMQQVGLTAHAVTTVSTGLNDTRLEAVE
jgi:4-diphosphocytidyl-2-C-methyl-D-erythritol kinase